MYAREMAEAERAIDSEGVLSFTEAVGELIDVCISSTGSVPSFTPSWSTHRFSPSAAKTNRFLGRFSSTSSRPASDASYPLSLAPKRPTMAGSPYGLPRNPRRATVASPHARPRLQQAMRNAVLRYLTPVLTESKTGRAGRSA